MQLGLEVGPGGVGALGDRVVALVEDLVEDLQALVGQADLVGVGVASSHATGQRPCSQPFPHHPPVPVARIALRTW
jgi:hypothetical protein